MSLVTNAGFHTMLLTQVDFNLNVISLRNFKSVMHKWYHWFEDISIFSYHYPKKRVVKTAPFVLTSLPHKSISAFCIYYNKF
jgi:hypothetical protein